MTSLHPYYSLNMYIYYIFVIIFYAWKNLTDDLVINVCIDASERLPVVNFG